MDGVALTAKERMGQSSQAVDQFRASVLQSSADLARAAESMGSGMEAANDAIVSSSQRSADAIREISTAAEQVDTRSLSEKLPTAFGNGVGAGIVAAQTAINGFIEYTKTKAIVIGAVVAAAFAAVGLGAVYTAYKVVAASVSTIKDLMTGDFFKSSDIDSVIALNDKIKELQASLNLSSIEAGALHDALQRLGVSPTDYTAVYKGMASAIRTNTEELDRLGVKYKDANGKFQEQEHILQNAKDVLDQYRAGWDRTQAATAIGMGTYEQITQALKVNNQEVKNSAERLNEYGLGMSQYGQEALARYQQTMREFDNENRLFSEGIKRVWSDAVMPAYTDIANVFKQGWPSIVSAFRVVVSTMVGLGYAMADGLYIAYRSITATVKTISDTIVGLAAASAQLANGNIKGAGDVIAATWGNAKAQVKAAGKDMVDVILENDKKIRLGTGADGRNTPIELAKDRVKAGRVWQPAPKKDDAKQPLGEKDDPARKVFEGYIKQQDDLIAAEKTQMATREQFMQSYYQQEYLTASDFYGRKIALIKDNLQTELDAYDREIKAAEDFRKTRDKEQDRVAVENKIADIQRKKAAAIVEANKQIGQSQLDLMAIQRQFDLQSQEWSHQRDLQNQQAAFNIDMMGRSTLEVQKLTEAWRIDAEVQERIYQLRKKDPNADVTGALAEAEKQKAIAMQMIEAAWDKQTSAAYGASEAIRKYGEEARNIGQQVEGVMTNAFRSMEDAFANFVTTGKFSFKDLVGSITADLARMSFKGAMSSMLDAFKGSSIGQSLMGALGGAFGGLQTPGFNPNAGSAIGAAAGAASNTAASTAMATLGTSATASTTALAAMTASMTANDVALTTASASLGALPVAADTAAAAMAASAAAGGGASGLGAIASLAGGGGGGDAGMAAMLAGQFADGGDPPVGKVSLVGERGPELFVPKQAGTIIPNDFFKNAAANDGPQQVVAPNITINNHFPANTSRDTVNQAAAKQGLQVQRAMRGIG
jgi:hypothetical protein